jgi:23S rRNA pseudouridine1911/1915/1917 synthase
MKQRLDQRLRELHPDLSWTRIRNAIARGQVTVDGAVEQDAGREVTASAAIDYNPSRPARSSARLDLPRLYEDEEILVIDKPAGLLTIASHPEARHTEDTVLRRAQEYAKRLHGRAGYAGMLHRLDRDTSGALAIALTPEAHTRGRELFAEHKFERWYLAIVERVPASSRGTIDAPISDEYVSGRRKVARQADEGRHAITHYRVRETYRDAALLELQLETGRQHQIRIHLEQLGHPLVGEKVYAGEAPRARAPRPMLHAWRLEFPHPLRRKVIRAEAPIPADFAKIRAAMSRRT